MDGTVRIDSELTSAKSMLEGAPALAAVTVVERERLCCETGPAGRGRSAIMRGGKGKAT